MATNTTDTCTTCSSPLPGGPLGRTCPACILTLALTPDPTGTAPSDSTGDLPRYFADHEILGEIARGGMGVVYHARRLGIDREVALKVVRTGSLATPDARLRFSMEVEAVSKLDHPGIVTLFETGEEDGVHYFSMPFYESGTLAEALPTLDLPARVTLLSHVAEATHHAHSRGILHRDIKPSNILLTPDAQPVLTDFGLVKLLHQASGTTLVRTVLGSPRYMAPEQSRGDTVTTAADIFSLGAILGEMLGSTAGRPPRDLAAIHQKATATDPGQRYTTASHLAADLHRYRSGEPVRARRRSTLATATLWSKRNPAFAATLAACLLLLTALTIGSTLAALRITRAERIATQRLHTLQLEKVDSLAATGRGSQSLALLQEVARANPGDPTTASHLASARGHRSFPTLTSTPFRHPPRTIAAGWSPRGKSLTTLAADGTLRRWPLAPPGPGRKLPPVPAPPARAAFSQDATTLLSIGTRGSLTLWSASGETVRQLAPPSSIPDPASGLPGFSPPGTHALARTSKTTLTIWHTDPEQTIPPLTITHSEPISRWAISPDSTLLVTAGERGRIRFWSFPDCTPLPDTDAHHQKTVTALAFTPDGQHLATATTAGGGLTLWHTATRTPRHLPTNPARNIRHLAISPGGTTLAAIDATGTTTTHSIPDGTLIAGPFGGGAATSGLTFDATGTHLCIATEANAVQLWHLPTGPRPGASPLSEPARTTVGVHSARLTAPGRLTALAHDGTLYHYSLQPPALTTPLQHISQGTIPPIHRFQHTTYSTPQNLPPLTTASGETRVTITGTTAQSSHHHQSGTLDHGATITRATLSAHGTHLATASADGTIRTWHLPTATQLATITLPSTPLRLALSPDATLLATAARPGHTTTWHTATGKSAGPHLAPGKRPAALSFTPKNNTLLLATARRLYLIHPATGEITWHRHHRPRIHAAALSPDGLHIAAALADGTAALHTIATPPGTPPTTFPHGTPLSHATFSPSGDALLTASFTRTLRLWHIPTRRPLTILLPVEYPITSTGFTTDATRILATTNTGHYRTWQIPKFAP